MLDNSPIFHLMQFIPELVHLKYDEDVVPLEQVITVMQSSSSSSISPLVLLLLPMRAPANKWAPPQSARPLSGCLIKSSHNIIIIIIVSGVEEKKMQR